MERTNDLISALSAIVEKNTVAYKEDFDCDIKTLYAAVKEPKIEDRTFYWVSRPHGTWCVKEREVFLRGTTAHNIWTHYETGNKDFKAYRVVITGEQDGKLTGHLYRLNYAEQIRRVMASALPVHHVSGLYADGETFCFPYSEMMQNSETKMAIERHGGIERLRYEPENEQELSDLIEREHRTQDLTAKRPRQRKAPSKRR